ncbi:MAG: hypothetical protein D6681_16710 [Calditrichaeota bacterium]|nr:MAG: hypothetical protein D6681_16710 [Calditrichota bacterium]
MWKKFPLLIIPVAIYHGLILAEHFAGIPLLTVPFLKIVLPSQAPFSVTIAQALVALGVLILYFEVTKSVHPDSRSVAEHVFSTFLLVGMVVEFLLVKSAGTPYFLILGIMQLVDVLCGFSVGIGAAKKDIEIGPVGGQNILS